MPVLAAESLPRSVADKNVSFMPHVHGDPARLYGTHGGHAFDSMTSLMVFSEYHLIQGREHTDVLAAPETLRLVERFLERL